MSHEMKISARPRRGAHRLVGENRRHLEWPPPRQARVGGWEAWKNQRRFMADQQRGATMACRPRRNVMRSL